jgi:acetyl esterase/lipase
MRNLLLLFFCLASLAASAQTRYKDLVFSGYTLDKKLSYSDKHLFDLYQPKDDSASRRPLMIWIHGGGFKFGSRQAAGTRLWCRTFAQRGYVCAAIDYQLGKKNFSFTFGDLIDNCRTAVQDVREAVAFFKANAARWHIDTTRIILAGNSAGGMLALQAVYSNAIEMQKLPRTKEAAVPGWDANDLVEGAAVGRGAPGGKARGTNAIGIAAVVNYWGALFDTLWLRQARVPIVSVHGDRDGIVPYDHKGYPLFGSLPIHRMADVLGIPNALKTYTGYSHELQKHFFPLITGGGTKKRWREAGQFTADFLYTTLFSRNE